jgi:hypothetical protein
MKITPPEGGSGAILGGPEESVRPV